MLIPDLLVNKTRGNVFLGSHLIFCIRSFLIKNAQMRTKRLLSKQKYFIISHNALNSRIDHFGGALERF